LNNEIGNATDEEKEAKKRERPNRMTIKEGGNYYELRYRYNTEERGRRRWERPRWSWSWRK
jgi:hypothetical protein